MKILCAFYICVMLTFEGARLTTPVPWQQQQHLSHKLNRDEPPPLSSSSSSSLQPAGEQHHHPTAEDDDDDDNLYNRRECQQSPASKCLWRADKLPDHIAEPHHPQWVNTLPSLRKLLSIRWRSKREARAPAHFLPRYHLRHYPGRNHRKVIRHQREGFKRRDHRRRRRRKRKRKRSQPGDQIVVTSLSPSVTVQTTGVETNNKLASTLAPNVAEAHSTTKEETSSHVVFIVVSCLLAFIVSGVLLFYLYSKSRRKPGFDPFFCPPEIGQAYNQEQGNPSDIDRCTCCSSEKRAPPLRLVPEPKKQQRATKSTIKIREAKKATKPVKKKPPIGRKLPVKQVAPFSETELREIQSRIACILRHNCARCNCCKCNAVDTEEEPKRSKKFKFFGRRNKLSTATPLCNDTRCDENKIRCLVNLCRGSDTGGLRIKQ